MTKTIFITGSSRGIGAATARLAAERGYEVILHGRTESDHLEQVAKEIPNSKVVTFNLFEVGDDSQIVTRALQDVGVTNVDVLVNNAGEIITDGSWTGDETLFQASVMGNIAGTRAVSKAVVPFMTKPGSSIVNLSSVYSTPAAAAAVMGYSMSRAAIDVLTVALAKELSPNIRVNAVAPSVVNTDMTKNAGPELIELFTQQILLKRLAEPAEIARVIMFLASDEASFITGQIIRADGGYLVSNK